MVPMVKASFPVGFLAPKPLKPHFGLRAPTSHVLAALFFGKERVPGSRPPRCSAPRPKTPPGAARAVAGNCFFYDHFNINLVHPHMSPPYYVHLCPMFSSGPQNQGGNLGEIDWIWPHWDPPTWCGGPCPSRDSPPAGANKSKRSTEVYGTYGTPREVQTSKHVQNWEPLGTIGNL
jgi:hypothetical protein